MLPRNAALCGPWWIGLPLRSAASYTPAMLRYTLFGMFVASAMAFAQTNPNSITVTASRNTNLQPDQVVYAVTVASPLTSSRDDVVAALQGSGIGLGNFSSVSTVQS